VRPQGDDDCAKEQNDRYGHTYLATVFGPVCDPHPMVNQGQKPAIVMTNAATKLRMAESLASLKAAADESA
jgi:hypothetical protein